MSAEYGGRELPAAPGNIVLFENDRVRVWSMTLGANGGIYDFHQQITR